MGENAADELTEVMKRFDLSDKEAGGVRLDRGCLMKGEETCKQSIIGRIIGEKGVNMAGLRNVMNMVWGYPKKLEIVELRWNLFQFWFNSELDKQKVLQKTPYLIDNQLLVLKEWEPGIESRKEEFFSTSLWVQIWNIPVHWAAKETGRTIGSVFKGVLDVSIPPRGSKEGRHIRVLAELDISRPLLRGTKVVTEEGARWVEFRYERCPDFCYRCGIIGHGHRSCSGNGREDNNREDNQYGVWMKAARPKINPKHREGRDERSKDAGRQVGMKMMSDEMVESKGGIPEKEKGASSSSNTIVRCSEGVEVESLGKEGVDNDQRVIESLKVKDEMALIRKEGSRQQEVV